MERIRSVFGTHPDPHSGEHREIERRLDQQKIALARLDAYVTARRGPDRRHQMTPAHPGRRSSDA